MEQKKRYSNIDILKSFAMVCVLFIHCFGIRINFWENGLVSNYVVYFFRTILSVSVPIFFICNGFLLFGKELDLRKHIIKTIKYVFLTYLWAIITILLTLFIKDARMSFGEIVYTIRDWEPGWVNHLWFLGALTRIYIIFPIIKLAVDRKRECLFYLVPVLFFFIMLNKGMRIVPVSDWIDTCYISFEIFNPLKDGRTWIFFYFCLGGVLFFYYDRVKEWFINHRRKCNFVCAIIIFVNCVLLFVFGVYESNAIHKHWDVIWEGYDMPFTIISSVCIFLLSLNYKEKEGTIISNTIRTISTNTLGIYLVHIIIINFWVAKISNYLPLDNFGSILLCTTITLVLSTFITVILKKIHGISWLVK